MSALGNCSNERRHGLLMLSASLLVMAGLASWWLQSRPFKEKPMYSWFSPVRPNEAITLGGGVVFRAGPAVGWASLENVRIPFVPGTRLAGQVYVSDVSEALIMLDESNREWYLHYFQAVTEGLESTEAKLIALTQAVARGVDHLDEPAKVSNARAVLEGKSGWCGDVSLAVATIARTAGYPARILNLENAAGYGHIVAEVMYDGRWHLFDADYATHYTLSDESVAGFYDILAEGGRQVRERHDNGLDTFYVSDVVKIHWVGDSKDLAVKRLLPRRHNP